MASGLISNEEKRLALERVVASHTFSRSDQLRSFLRYICEAEFEGRASGHYVMILSGAGAEFAWARLRSNPMCPSRFTT